MKEFTEKLIGRLEELKTFKLNLADAMSELMKKDKLDNYISKEEVVEIINQLAEEYKTCYKSCAECESYDKEKHYCPKWCDVIKHTTEELAEEYNDFWITDRNPTREECGEYGYAEFQVTISQPKGNKTITMDFIYETVRGKEVARWKWHGRLPIWEVLAWKKLDEPYQPKGE